MEGRKEGGGGRREEKGRVDGWTEERRERGKRGDFFSKFFLGTISPESPQTDRQTDTGARERTN
jgi:hypothetical protein